MSKSICITCDACGYDLSTGGNSQMRTIVLNDVERPSDPSLPYTAMWIEPLGEHHFCNLLCLQKWVGENVPA